MPDIHLTPRNRVSFRAIKTNLRDATQKPGFLISLNPKLSVLRYQTRLLLDFKLFSAKRYEYAIKLIDNIGRDLGGWIAQQNH